MKKWFLLLLCPFTLYGGEFGESADLEQGVRHKSIELEEEIFDLQRKVRRLRLWARHYDREAQRMFHMDWGLYRKWIRRAEDNRQQAADIEKKVIALEDQRLDLKIQEGIFR